MSLYALTALGLLCGSVFAEDVISFEEWKKQIVAADTSLIPLLETETASEYFAVYRHSGDVIAVCYHDKLWNDWNLAGTTARTNPKNKPNRLQPVPVATLKPIIILISKELSKWQFPDVQFYQIFQPDLPLSFYFSARRRVNSALVDTIFDVKLDQSGTVTINRTIQKEE